MAALIPFPHRLILSRSAFSLEAQESIGRRVNEQTQAFFFGRNIARGRRHGVRLIQLN